MDRAAKRALQLGRDEGTPAHVPEDAEIVDPTERCRHKGPRGRLQDEAEGDLATDRKKTPTPHGAAGGPALRIARLW